MSGWGIADVARAVTAPSRRLDLVGHGRAAILVPLLETPAGLELLFTIRAAGLTRHAGQISFPGGRLEPGEGVVEAALREADEEVGLAVAPADVLGFLDDRPSPFGLVATPVVARVAWPAPLRLDPGEVAGTFTLPLADLAACRPTLEEFLHEGVVRQLYRYRVGGHEVWGLTGNVVRDLLERLAGHEVAA